MRVVHDPTPDQRWVINYIFLTNGLILIKRKHNTHHSKVGKTDSQGWLPDCKQVCKTDHKDRRITSDQMTTRPQHCSPDMVSKSGKGRFRMLTWSGPAMEGRSPKPV